jgi:undecaprenyl-diphosphatase
MTYLQIVILAIIQGLAELLPVSSSAHVITAAKLMRLDPSAPAFTLLLVMLHTGTMFAVIVYFWNAWMRAFFSTRENFKRFAVRIIVATIITGVIALGLKWAIEHYLHHRHPEMAKAEIEELFKHMELLAGALAVVGLLILYSGLRSRRAGGREEITTGDSVAIGAIQGLCLPFRGFSRSGATISLGLLRGVARQRLEEYSFALAVVLTPAVVAWEARRLIQHQAGVASGVSLHDFSPSLIGMAFSFVAGLIALKLLSRLLERGQWWIFGIYCLIAAGAVYGLYLNGY